MRTVVIVGAGSAGMTIAWRLSCDPSVHVVLLDAGTDPGPVVPDALRRDMLLPPEFYWPYVEAETGAFLPRGKVLGGTSAANAAAAVRGQPAGFDAWGLPGWSWADCLPSFIALEADQQYGDRAHHGDAGPIPITRYPTESFDAVFRQAYDALGYPAIDDHNEPYRTGHAPWPTNRTGTDRASTLLQMLPDLRRRPNVEIRAGVEVRSVLIDGGVARGVLTGADDGSVLVGGDTVILAGGTFGSPEILFASGIGDPDDLRAAGLDVTADLPGVGRNLSDHPFLQMVVEVTDARRYPLGAGQGTLLTFDLTEPHPTHGHLFAYRTDCFDPTAAESQASVTVALMNPASRGHLTLGAGGRAAVHLGHYTHPDDVQRGVALVTLAREVIDRVAANGLIKAPDGAWWRSADVAPLLRSRAVSYHHPVGTCRMGSGADCVVGTDLQVHGVAGLYVADASIMPALPTGTPNLAAMMIGWRAAELIAPS